MSHFVQLVIQILKYYFCLFVWARTYLPVIFVRGKNHPGKRVKWHKTPWLLTWVSVSMRLVATSNLFGRERYLFCLNCFSSSRSCWDVNAVLGRLVFPSNACPGPQPTKQTKISHIIGCSPPPVFANPFYLRTITNETAYSIKVIASFIPLLHVNRL